MYLYILILAFIFPLAAEPIRQTAPVVVLGEGMAGMSAALQLSQAGLHPLVITGLSPGGIITVSQDVENWPGDLLISGAHLADRLEQQIEKRGVKLLPAMVTQVDFSRAPFKIYAKNFLLKEESYEIETPCCIIATGALPNLLKVPGEVDLLYQKIFTCAPCDGLRFKDQTVAVIGGGESALVEADYLSHLAKKVFILVRGKSFKSFQPALKEKLLSKPNVEILYQTTVHGFKNDPSGVQLQLQAGKSPKTLLVQGAFLAIGSTPNTQIFKKSLELDPDGYIVLKQGQMTSVPGVFAAGDVSDRLYKQAITAAGDATKAALQAIQFLSSSPTTIMTKDPSSVLEITDLETLQQTIHSSKWTVAYFYSSSCMPCRAFKPLFLRWSEKYGEIATFIKINNETCPPCFDSYQVQSIPTVLILDSEGTIQKHAAGLFQMPRISSFLEEHQSGH